MHKAVACIVGAQYLAILLIEAISGFGHIPALSPLPAALGLTIFALGAVSLLHVARLAANREQSPSRALLRKLASSGDVPFVYLAVAAQLIVLVWLKTAMPYSVGFRADEALASLDAALFGTDPWRLLTWLPGPLLDQAYITWATSTICVMMILLLLPSSPKRNRAITAYFLVVAFASLGQYLAPSAGPIFYERLGLGTRFSDLPIQPWVKSISNYLWANYLSKGANVGAGISAFPSLHVGGAAWVAIVASSFLPRLTLLWWGYFLLILGGSVILGWHYAIDGIAGAIASLAAYLVAGRLLRQSSNEVLREARIPKLARDTPS